MQDFARREREHCIDRDFLRLGLLILDPRRRQRLREPRRQRRFGIGARARVHLGQEQLHHALEQARIAPVQIERLIEQRLLLVPLDQHRFQRGAEILAPLDAHRLYRFQRDDHLRRSDRQARSAQYAHEMKDVFGKSCSVAGVRCERLHDPSSAAASRRASPTSCVATSGETAPMSS